MRSDIPIWNPDRYQAEAEHDAQEKPARRTAIEYLQAAAGEPLVTGPYDIEEYPDLPGISVSRLKLITKSIDHFVYEYDHPSPSTPATELGTDVHEAVLEPKLFERNYAMRMLEFEQCYMREEEGIDRRTTAGKARYAQLLIDAGEREILKPKVYDAKLDDLKANHDLALTMADAVHRHPEAAELLASEEAISDLLPGGQAEIPVAWVDTTTGLLCKARFDWIGGSSITDLKTSRDASPSSFGREWSNYKYYMQAPFYVDGWLASTGELMEFKFVVVEKSPPHAVSVYPVNKEAMDVGHIAYQRALRRVQKFLEDPSQWTGYPLGNEPLDLPVWEKKKFQRRW
jgi:hypothetical protein